MFSISAGTRLNGNRYRPGSVGRSPELTSHSHYQLGNWLVMPSVTRLPQVSGRLRLPASDRQVLGLTPLWDGTGTPALVTRCRSGGFPPVADQGDAVLAAVEPVMNDNLILCAFVPAAGRFLRFENESPVRGDGFPSTGSDAKSAATTSAPVLGQGMVLLKVLPENLLVSDPAVKNHVRAHERGSLQARKHFPDLDRPECGPGRGP